MTKALKTTALTAAAFAPYGDVIEISGTPDMMINQGMCGRYHDLATLDFKDGHAGISLFDANARDLPHVVDMVERHPMGSQAFLPLSPLRFLVVVADDADGTPVNLKAFVTTPGQCINLRRNVWHGVLCPLNTPGKFAVIDHIGDGPNLEEHWFDAPFIVNSVD